MIAVCPYWQVPLKAWDLKWSCQKALNQTYSWFTFIFPLVCPCIIMCFGVFPFPHPLAKKVPIFFSVNPPAIYTTLGDWILPFRCFSLSLGDDSQHSFSTTPSSLFFFFFVKSKRNRKRLNKQTKLFPMSSSVLPLNGPKGVNSAPSVAGGPYSLLSTEHMA